MMKKIIFYKYHGCQNDFIILDNRLHKYDLTTDQVSYLCDRNKGIGADGVLYINSASIKGADISMRLQNKDGSNSDMCGNGLRCVALFLCDQEDISLQQKIKIHIKDSLYICERKSDDEFEVNMGEPILIHPHLPKTNKNGEVALSISNQIFKTQVVWIGNPHAIIFKADLKNEKLLQYVKKWGKTLSEHALFPHQANISFVHPLKNGFEAIIYERGVGITKACGSGACAIAYTSLLKGFSDYNKPINIYLQGGHLTIRINKNNTIFMRGQAKKVFKGTLIIE